MIPKLLGFDVLQDRFGFGGADVPDRLLVKPIDPWPGSAQEGAQICAESHDIRGGHLQAWPERLHRFFWLRDLRALGGADARACGRDMVMQWMVLYGGRPKSPAQKLAWRSDILGERISNWISHFDFIENCHEGGAAEEEFHEMFFGVLYAQAQVLARKVPSGIHDLELLKALKGLLYAGLAFEGHELWIEKALDLLRSQIEIQFLADGAHISRSPMQLMRGLQILLDVKAALSAGAYPLPEEIQHAIDRAGPALKFFRMGDKKLFTAHATHKGCSVLLDSVLAQAGVRAKVMSSLPVVGYERVAMNRSLLVFDCGDPPPFPYDGVGHAAPLNFEFSYGRDRIFVNCGTHVSDEDWAGSLRATAAHNALCLDHRNAYEIREDGSLARKAKSVQARRDEEDGAVFLEASHDGYLPVNGAVHKRQLYLGEKGHDLRGAEMLDIKVKPVKPIDIAVRFHLHPRVLVSLVQNGQGALIRLPNGIGWRFQIGQGALALEDSVYVGDGINISKTKQLVIYAQTEQKRADIQWRFHREGVS